MSGLRTKESVEDGIWWIENTASSSTLLEYQPGNGTRYLMMITRLKGPGTRALQGMGFGTEEPAGVVVVSWLSNCKTWAFRDTGYLDARYVAEKFDTTVHDGAVIAEMIAHFTNRTAQPAIVTGGKEAQP